MLRRLRRPAPPDGLRLARAATIDRHDSYGQTVRGNPQGNFEKEPMRMNENIAMMKELSGIHSILSIGFFPIRRSIRGLS